MAQCMAPVQTAVVLKLPLTPSLGRSSSHFPSFLLTPLLPPHPSLPLHYTYFRPRRHMRPSTGTNLPEPSSGAAIGRHRPRRPPIGWPPSTVRGGLLLAGRPATSSPPIGRHTAGARWNTTRRFSNPTGYRKPSLIVGFKVKERRKFLDKSFISSI